MPEATDTPPMILNPAVGSRSVTDIAL